MAEDFRFIKTLIGSSPEIQTATADAALERGDIAHFDADNELSKLADGGFEVDIVLVLEDAEADETLVPYIWLDPWVLIEGEVKGTQGDVGDMYHIDITSTNQKFEAATIWAGKQFINRKNVDADTSQMVRFYPTYTT